MYVIAGVTGNTGKVAAQALLDRGEKVRVVVRDATKGEPWRAKGAEVAVADVGDAASLAAALEGAEGAYLLLPPNFASTDNVRDNAARTRAIGEALAKSGVPHVVFLSSVGAQHPDGTGPIKTLHHAEVELPKAAPRTRFTFLRAAYFVENVASVLGAAKADGVLPSMFDPAMKIPMIAAADIGRIAADALVEGPPERSTAILELAGPREVSFDDLAAELSALLGKTVSTVRVPNEAVKGALMQAGLGEDLASLYQEMAGGIDAGRVAFQGEGTRLVRGTVEAREVLRALLG